MSDTKAKASPAVTIAATSITLFSLVGIGVLTGIIPSSYSKDSERAALAAVADAPAAAPAPRLADARQAAARQAAAPAKPKRVAAACTACGTVTSIHVVKSKGEGSGLGAVAGGVVGGVLGNQVGGGRGRDLATVAGVAGGALAGHELEKRYKSEKHYQVAVRMDDGAVRHFTYDHPPAFETGEKVKIVDGRLTH